jgi:uncharacterized protein
LNIQSWKGVIYIIKRDLYLNKIKPFIGNDLIKVLTGIRRSGKSVMLELIKNELLAEGILVNQFISMNFENINNQKYCYAESLNKYISERLSNISGKAYLFLDEIQEVENWEKCINSLRINFDCDIYITGSNAKLLSGELATYLAGRYVEFIIYPFSFLEFVQIHKYKNNSITKEEAFKQFINIGGMPFLANLKFDYSSSMQYLEDVYNSVVLKDVMKRNSIRDVDMLEKIIIYILANVGQPFSATSISKYFKSENRKVSTETVLNYIKACEDAFLFYRIRRNDLLGKKILSVNEKYYIADHGIREAIYGKNNQDINLILENIICMELLRRGYTVTVGKLNNLEVDFVCEKRGERIYIQVSYILATDETIRREFGSLGNINDNFPKYVLSLDEFTSDKDGIKHLNIRDFLLGNYL